MAHTGGSRAALDRLPQRPPIRSLSAQYPILLVQRELIFEVEERHRTKYKNRIVQLLQDPTGGGLQLHMDVIALFLDMSVKGSFDCLPARGDILHGADPIVHRNSKARAVNRARFNCRC